MYTAELNCGHLFHATVATLVPAADDIVYCKKCKQYVCVLRPSNHVYYAYCESKNSDKYNCLRTQTFKTLRAARSFAYYHGHPVTVGRF